MFGSGLTEVPGAPTVKILLTKTFCSALFADDPALL
jgi:hypothetical protein